MSVNTKAATTTKTSKGIVRLSNTSDFVEPSQKCILPIQNAVKKKNDGLVSLHSKNSQNLIKKKVRITLQDCLACSGCVTTTENNISILESF
uniref:Uncharacterized protein n=2 Tax=Meloidogyne TaxID=189290 RepID=A0A6V7WMN5_MELEN|nr:unnamed protein product [Meloidogyne enterolobii]